MNFQAAKAELYTKDPFQKYRLMLQAEITERYRVKIRLEQKLADLQEELTSFERALKELQAEENGNRSLSS